MPKLTKTVVDAAISRAKQFTIWCSELKGFGVFIQPSGSRTYFVDYRNREGARKRMTIGRHGKVTCEQARKLAIATLGETVKGQDPAEERARERKAITVEDLCDRYLAAAEKGLILGKGNRPKKASSLYVDGGRINRHIIPLLGKKRVQSLKPADISKFIEDVASGKTAVVEKTKKRGKSVVRGGLGTATRTAGLLGGILTYAVQLGAIESNPARGVRKPADGVRKRRLTDEEYRLLGKILREKANDEQFDVAIKAIRHLALTACRRSEAIYLKKSEIDFVDSCLRLSDSKEGASVRPIGLPVLDQLMPIIGEAHDGGFVFEGTVEGKPLIGFPKLWKKIFKDTDLATITPHVLRHSFSSIANDLGFTEATIGSLIGHSRGSVTGRYIHTIDTMLIMAADTIAGYIQGLLDGKTFKRTSYALDRASREATLSRLLAETNDDDDQRLAA